MSPRKTRRAVKTKDTDDESLMETTMSSTRHGETPNVTLRSKRTRQQNKVKSDSDEDLVDQSIILNRSTRSAKKKLLKNEETTTLIGDVIDESINITKTKSKKRAKKEKKVSIPVEDTQNSDDIENDNLSDKKIRQVRGRKKKNSTKKTNDDKLNIEDDEKIIINDAVSSEDNEVANVSAKIAVQNILRMKKKGFRQLHNRNRNSSSITDITPESSPITVTLTPHRSKKTPRKSPINIGSPKTHSLSPQRLSKTPRKLPVTSPSIIINKLSPKQKIKSPRKSSTPKINSRKSTSKSPNLKKVNSNKINKKLSIKKSTTPKKLIINNKEILHDHILNEIDNDKSPQVLLKRVSTSMISKSPKIKPIVAISPTKKQQSPIKLSPSSNNNIESIEELSNKVDKTPTKPILTSRFHRLSKSSTPIKFVQLENNNKITSSTPHEKNLRSQNLSSSILSVDTFYGASPKTSSTKIHDNENIGIEDESIPLISDDNDTFEISGITAANNTTINKDDLILLPNVDKSDNKDDTYELEVPKTPNLRMKKNDTYELEEAKTPGLIKRATKRSINNKIDDKTDEIVKKRARTVRFESPSINKLNKSKINNQSISLRSATPATKKRSNSLINLSIKTPTSIIKKRSKLNIDENSAIKAQNESVNRLSKPRQSLTIEKKKINNTKISSAKKIPNFAQIHQKKFAELESIVDVKKRIKDRHNELTNNNINSLNLSKSGVKNGQTIGIVKPVIKNINDVTTNGSYNRYGFKIRKSNVAQAISKEVPLTKIQAKKDDKRQILKGVRSNRRFELMMKARNIN